MWLRDTRSHTTSTQSRTLCAELRIAQAPLARGMCWLCAGSVLALCATMQFSLMNGIFAYVRATRFLFHALRAQLRAVDSQAHTTKQHSPQTIRILVHPMASILMMLCVLSKLFISAKHYIPVAARLVGVQTMCWMPMPQFESGFSIFGKLN